MIILGREPLHEGNAYKNKDKGNRGEPQIGGGEFTRYI